MIDGLLDDAQRVAKGACAPGYSKEQYEDAMLKIAGAEARPGESQAVAFSRLISDHDPRMRSLYKAARRAAAESEEAATRAEIAKAASAKERIFALMEKVVSSEKRKDETSVAAFNRLVREDKELREAYVLYRALG